MNYADDAEKLAKYMQSPGVSHAAVDGWLRSFAAKVLRSEAESHYDAMGNTGMYRALRRRAQEIERGAPEIKK